MSDMQSGQGRPSRRRRQRAARTPADAGSGQVVADAKQKGIDLKIVVLEQNPPIDTPLRDIATEVGQAYPGSTVLVISPSFAGTYSTTFDRVTLEAGQDIAKVSGDPVQSSKNFVTELTTPHFPWTPFTIVLVLGGGGGRCRNPHSAGPGETRRRGGNRVATLLTELLTAARQIQNVTIR